MMMDGFQGGAKARIAIGVIVGALLMFHLLVRSKRSCVKEGVEMDTSKTGGLSSKMKGVTGVY